LSRSTKAATFVTPGCFDLYVRRWFLRAEFAAKSLAEHSEALRSAASSEKSDSAVP